MPKRRENCRASAVPAFKARHAVRQRRQQCTQLGMAHQVKKTGIGHRLGDRHQIARNVVDEGHRSARAAAKLTHRRSFGSFSRHQRIGQSETVEQSAPDRPVPVRHGAQKNNLQRRGKRFQRIDRTRGSNLPVALNVEEFRHQCADRIGIRNRTVLKPHHVAVNAKAVGEHCHALAVQKADEGIDKFQDDFVNVDHQQRTLIAREFRDLPRGLGIVAHVEA